MPDKKPLSVRILLGLILLKIIIAPTILAAYLMTGDVDGSETSFAGGFRTAINDRFGIGYGISGYHTGYLVGKLTIPLFIALLLLTVVSRRNFVWTVVAVSLDLLVSMTSGLPIVPIAMLILVLTNPTKNYLKRKDTPGALPPSTPIDYELMNKDSSGQSHH